LANDINDETPWQKIEWWKATFPVEFPLYCAVLTSAAEAVYTRLHDCACFKIKSNDSPLHHFLKQHRSTLILVGDQNMGASLGHHLLSFTEGLILLCDEQSNWKFFESKQIYWSVATANTSNIQLVHRHFSSVKYVDPLNAANIFDVHAFLHGICK